MRVFAGDAFVLLGLLLLFDAILIEDQGVGRAERPGVADGRLDLRRLEGNKDVVHGAAVRQVFEDDAVVALVLSALDQRRQLPGLLRVRHIHHERVLQAEIYWRDVWLMTQQLAGNLTGCC